MGKENGREFRRLDKIEQKKLERERQRQERKKTVPLSDEQPDRGEKSETRQR